MVGRRIRFGTAFMVCVYICADGLAVAILSVNLNCEWINKVISHLGKCTYGVYLIHWAVLAELKNIGIIDKIAFFQDG